MKVYYYSRVLENQGVNWLRVFSQEARHTGIIIDDENSGLVKIEIDRVAGQSKLIIKSIDKFHRQTNSNKGVWCYEVGETNLNYDEVIKASEQWCFDNPEYGTVTSNCRTFTNSMLLLLIQQNGAYDESINTRRFDEDPCREAEQRIKEDGFNVPNHIYSNQDIVPKF